MFNRFTQVVLNAQEKKIKYPLILSGVEVTTLHGAVALAMKHPGVGLNAIKILQDLRVRILEILKSMGFTDEEVKYMDTQET